MTGFQRERFASPEWIETLRRAAAGASVDPDLRLTVEQHLEDGAAWHFTFADGTVVVAEGRTDEADIVLTSSRATAIAIHDGELSAQRAFLDGDLQIGGDITALIEHRAALSEVAALMAAAT